MMFVILLVPVVLLGLLLGMDRLERWTVDDGDAPGMPAPGPTPAPEGPVAP